MIEFVSGNLNNNIQTEKSFLYIERFDNGTWQVVATDSDWETKLYWTRTNAILGLSKVKFTWEIPVDASLGVYRIRHLGAYKYWLNGQIYEYQGETNSFEVR